MEINKNIGPGAGNGVRHVQLKPLNNTNATNILANNEQPVNILKSPDQLFKTVNDSNSDIQNISLFSGSNIDSSGPLLKQGTKVLIIGDSHTVGIYGQEMDKLARSTGATVQTYGVAGSSPSWWFSGTKTKCGFYSNDAEGHKKTAGMGDATPTPNIKELIAKAKPDVVIVSLGANMIASPETSVTSTTKKMADAIEQSGAKLVWVGPPKHRKNQENPQQLTNLYNELQSALPKDAKFIDSRPYTYYPKTGGDGIHFWGKEGMQIAKNWANQVFNQIQDQ